MEAIIINNYNKFRERIYKIDFPLEQRYRNGYFNVKVYSEQLEQFLFNNEIEFELVEDCYERFK